MWKRVWMMCVDITPPFLDFVINYSVIMYYVCIACILNIIKIIRLLLYCYFDCSTNAESHCHEVNKYCELSFWFSKFRERTNWKKKNYLYCIELNWRWFLSWNRREWNKNRQELICRQVPRHSRLERKEYPCTGLICFQSKLSIF